MSSDLHHLAAAYALNALGDQERRDFEAHYPSCEICSQEVHEFRQTAAAMAEAVHVEPPGELKAAVIAQIAQTRQLPPVTTAEGSLAQSTWWPPTAKSLLAVAAAFLLAFGGFSIGALGRNDSKASSDEVVIAVDPAIAEILDAPDIVFNTLEAAAGSSGSIEVIWSPSRSQVAIVGNGLDDPGPDKAYALWFLRDDAVSPAGLFSPDDGEVRTVLDVDDIETMGWGVTVEPSGGSDQPTTDVIYLTEI